METKSSKGQKDRRLSHEHNPRFLIEYIDKAMKRIRPFVEFVRMLGEANMNPLMIQIVKLRDICAHKLESVALPELQSIAESICFLNPILCLELHTLTLHSRLLCGSFKDMLVVNRAVCCDYLTRYSDLFDDNNKKRFLLQLNFPDVKATDSLEEIKEKIHLYWNTFTTIDEARFESDDIDQIQNLFRLFQQI
jgi:hypothetical protein